jgi:catechol-2,3-dioxygenase
MKRIHLHVGVKNIEESIQFYSTLFGQKPSKQKSDYAKWMLEDPKVNFAISTLTGTIGVDHLGIQVDEPKELKEITQRLEKAELEVADTGESTCCYARSEKSWITDPAGIPWETYRTMADIEVFKEKQAESEATCCPTEGADASETSCCG